MTSCHTITSHITCRTTRHTASACVGSAVIDGHYRRDSFDDRIYDDLCEELLSYLPFEDKNRLQCVSKQFRRCLHRQQHELTVRRQTLGHRYRRCLSANTFESLVRRFPYVRCVSLDLNDSQCADQLIELIVQYCHHLDSIHVNFFDKQQIETRTEYKPLVKEETLHRFMDRFGRQLRRIVVFENFGQILAICHNLYELNLSNSYYSFVCLRSAFATEESMHLMRSVRRLSFNYNSSSDYPLFRLFVANNRLTMESIECNETIDSEDNGSLLRQISQLVNLRKLKLHLHCDQIHDSLKTIAKSCRHLSQLEMSFYSSDTYLPFMVQNEVLNAIKHFRRLKRFTFYFIECCESDFLNQCFKRCRNLTHLSLYSINEITDSFFVDIDQHLPNLRHLKIINAFVGDSALHSLSKLSKLETISFFNLSDGSAFNESSVWRIVDNCPKISSIKFFFSSQPIGLSNHQIDVRIRQKYSKIN